MQHLPEEEDENYDLEYELRVVEPVVSVDLSVGVDDGWEDVVGLEKVVSDFELEAGTEIGLLLKQLVLLILRDSSLIPPQYIYFLVDLGC